ncbi:hypothetical protein WG907_16405 [Sphingobium sp. AN558]|uniref:DUF7065 domain-containing protein n=1 Tax=Sphingobium sp. AN558 TaxID=3133442 RepID=UPI0030C03A3E
MHVYPAKDELPHEPGAHEYWQESFVLFFGDLRQSVGGYLRLGHEPNFNGGQVATWTNIWSPAGTFHKAVDLPLRPEDRLENGFGSGDDTLRYEFDGRIRWTIHEEDLQGVLTVVEDGPAIDGYAGGDGKHLGEFVTNHVDTGVRVVGTLTVKGTTYEVDAYGIRDHGWGIRKWDDMRALRWTVAAFDTRDHFIAVSFILADNAHTTFGWVVRGDEVIKTKDLDIIAFINSDGATNRGGITRMNLPTGEILEARFEPIFPSMGSWIHGVMGFDTACVVRWGDKVGFGCFETVNNLQGGKEHPAVFDRATVADGWYPGVLPLDYGKRREPAA